MTPSLDIAWLAGLLDGEGCFQVGRPERVNPGIHLVMTDEDTVAKAARILRCRYAPYQPGGNRKLAYRLSVCGPHAIAWMLTVFTYMSKRRRAKIADIVNAWKANPNKPQMAKYWKTYGRQVA